MAAAPILSTVAHDRLLAVGASAALTMPGVYDVILARGDGQMVHLTAPATAENVLKALPPGGEPSRHQALA